MVLGPLLFLVYINNISIGMNGNILSFADGTTVFMSGDDPIQLLSHECMY